MIELVLTKHSGFLGPIAWVLGKIFEGIYTFFYQFGVENVAICIILFTFIVNALMIPLTFKQQKFSKLSAKMNPEITAIQAKYKGKKDTDSMQRMQAETQAVYQKYGVNPASGCLPMLITLPIFFALYRVIYNVPAYVPQIKVLYESIAEGIQGVNGEPTMLRFVKDATKNAFDNPVLVSSIKKGTKASSLTLNNLIDIMTQFRNSHWNILKEEFPSLKEVIANNHTKLMKINSFFGMNILESPSLKSATISIPILAVVTQFISTKLMSAGNKTSNDNNAAAASMKMMNTVMPIMTGIFCLMFPIGMGLYWVAGNVFRIVQTIFINKSMDSVDVESMILKNEDKRRKKIEKLGYDPAERMQQMAKQRTSSIKSNPSSYKNNVKDNNSNRGDNTINKKKVDGSIGGYANMLSNRGDKKEEK